MFRSVFAKYVTTFMALLTVSFLLLLFVVNSMVNIQADRTRQQQMASIAASCAQNASELYEVAGFTSLREFVLNGNEHATSLRRLVSASLASFDDMTVYVTDVGGGFLFSVGCASEEAPPIGNLLFDPSALSTDKTESTSSAEKIPGIPTNSSDTSIDAGSFPEQPILGRTNGSAYLFPITATAQGDLCLGYVLVTSDAEAEDMTSNDTLRSMIVAALWVMVAALIAIYFITERIVSPIRDMSKAAKRMAVGQFDVRVPVRGRDEVAQLAVAFNQMASALANLEGMRNTFVANVSHDLRTPMTTIAGFIDGILDGVIPPEQHTHYLRVVSEEVRRLSRLVTALLDVSRLQAGDRKFDKQPFDVCEMGRQILISFEKRIDEKRLDVEFDSAEDRMFVLADQDAIHQILYNICDNAVKFASERGKLKMSFDWSEADGNRHRKAVVKIYNEGQGIPSEDLPYVFDRFYKSDKSRNLDKSGVGLGMFISKTIMDAHGETIAVNSEYGKFCEFTFTLTRADPPVQKGRVGFVQGGTL